MKPWKDPAKAVKYLDKHKGLLGFKDWTITVIDMQDKDDDAIAQTIPNHYEKTLEVTLYKEYAKRDDWQTTLLHELIHVRIGIAYLVSDPVVEKARYEAIEAAVNDITRGIRTLMTK